VCKCENSFLLKIQAKCGQGVHTCKRQENLERFVSHVPRKQVCSPANDLVEGTR